MSEGAIVRDVSQKQAIGWDEQHDYALAHPLAPNAMLAAHVMCMSGEEKGSTSFGAHTQKHRDRGYRVIPICTTLNAVGRSSKVARGILVHSCQLSS